MAGEVELGGLAAAEFVEEGDVDVGESAGGAGVAESAFVTVLPPVDSDAASSSSSPRGDAKESLEEEDDE